MTTADITKLLTFQKNDKEGSLLQNAFGLAIIVGGGYFLYRQIRSELKTNAQKKANEKLYTEEQNPKIKLTYKPSQFKTFADKLEDAFNPDFFAGTDEQAIYQIISYLKTNNDWLELNKAYGLRNWYDNYIPFDQGRDLNLVSTLQKELETSEKNKVNTILKSKNITYRI
jgi:hypothetical protein